MRTVHPLTIWDWYDGIVAGLVTVSWRSGTFLASAIAWSPESKIRALSLLPLSEAQIAEVHRLANAEWEAAVGQLRAHCQSSTGEALLLLVDERSNEIISETVVDAGLVANDMMGDVEAIVAPSRRHWLAPGTP
jgi:hypothetical protein